MDEGPVKVLLVEDNPGDARLIREAFAEAGHPAFRLERVDRLSAGLECLGKKDVDVVLLDLMLPDSRGFDTFLKVYRRAPAVPVVVLTALDDETLAIRTVQEGAQDYLVKGKVDGSLLKRSLRYAIERKRAQEALRVKDRAIESSINPIAIADLEGNLTYVNRSFLKLWGYDADKEVLERPAADFWHMRIEASGLTEALHKTGSWIGRIHGRSRDGFPLDLQLSASLVKDELGEPLCMVFSFVDITELTQLRRRLKTEQSFAGIVGRDAKMLQLFDTIKELAEVNAPVLIQGESGTGKELVAAAIHNEGPRANKPFVPVNCSALPEGVLESELFGHVRGAFTGAIRDRKGRFELADSGTIFLDEIGDLPPAVQVKILRALQGGTFERVGSEQTIKVDVRVLSATNKDIQQEVAAGRFREDLFYRLCVVPVILPPLRERRNDIPLLAHHVLRKALAEATRQDVALSQEALEAMMDYDWPGNVRELENAIQYALVKCRGDVLQLQHLPPRLCEQCAVTRRPAKRRRKRKLSADAVQHALEQTDGDKKEAARRLGISRATLYRIIGDSKKAPEAESQ